MTDLTKDLQDQRIIYALSTNFVLYRGNEGEPGFFLFSLKDGKMFRLNKTSYAMLEALDGRRTVEEAIDRLATTLCGDRSVISKDILSMVSLWQEKGIVCKRDQKP